MLLTVSPYPIECHCLAVRLLFCKSDALYMQTGSWVVVHTSYSTGLVVRACKLSMTLERNDRLLTGLKLELINSKPSFLSSGLTTTVFHFLMNNPSHREALTILVMSGRIVGSSSLKMSSSQDLLLRELMTLRTPSSNIGANSFSFGTFASCGW